MSRAKRMALWISSIFRFESRAILESRQTFGIVNIESQFTTHGLGSPSSSPTGTSTAIPRMVVVTGATVTAVLTG